VKVSNAITWVKDQSLRAQVALLTAAPALANAQLADKAVRTVEEARNLGLIVAASIITLAGIAAGLKIATDRQANLKDVSPLLWGGVVAGSAAGFGTYIMS
jgi:hypothetical protein